MATLGQKKIQTRQSTLKAPMAMLAQFYLGKKIAIASLMNKKLPTLLKAKELILRYDSNNPLMNSSKNRFLNILNN